MGITLLTKEIKQKNIYYRNEVQYRDNVPTKRKVGMWGYYTYNLPYLQHQYQFYFVLIIQIVISVHGELHY